MNRAARAAKRACLSCPSSPSGLPASSAPIAGIATPIGEERGAAPLLGMQWPVLYCSNGPRRLPSIVGHDAGLHSRPAGAIAIVAQVSNDATCMPQISTSHRACLYIAASMLVVIENLKPEQLIPYPPSRLQPSQYRQHDEELYRCCRARHRNIVDAASLQSACIAKSRTCCFALSHTILISHLQDI